MVGNAPPNKECIRDGGEVPQGVGKGKRVGIAQSEG